MATLSLWQELVLAQVWERTMVIAIFALFVSSLLFNFGPDGDVGIRRGRRFQRERWEVS